MRSSLAFRFVKCLAVLVLVTGWTPDPVAANEPVPVPENMRVKNVPDLSPADAAGLRPYEHLRQAGFQGWHPSERRVLIATRFDETSQLHEVDFPLGARTQLTFYDERVFGGSYRPDQPSQVLFSYDEGGAENYQLFLLDRETGQARRLSDGVHRYSGSQWSRDGEHLTYVSNARNGRDFDIYVLDPDARSDDAERLVAEVQGFWFPVDWSFDNTKLLVGNYISANESSLHVLDLETGSLERLTPESPENRTVAWSGGKWSADGRHVYTATDADGNFMRLVRLDVETGDVETLTDDIDWNVEDVELSDDGRHLVFSVNEDGISKLYFLNTRTGARTSGPDLPPGVVGSIAFRSGSPEIGFTLTWARAPADVYSYHPETELLERWTSSEIGGLDAEIFPVPELVRYETFDEIRPGTPRTIPAFVYRPDSDRFPGPRPVYINIHGGPEGQSRPTFNGSNNYLMTELGVVYIEPNVRGSAGYGRDYLLLDNGAKREDSVKDIGALLDWIAAQPDLDSKRVMVGGGSYGGYMSLASMVLYGDRLKAGFDYVGISNFVTFLENTQDYRRDLRRVEYGDERDPEMRETLQKISPSNRADRINKPLLVAQGANDPRVPLSEADQIVAALSDSSIPVWYIVAEDEGHGFAKKTNSDYLRLAWIEFIRRYLLTPEVAPATGAEG